MPVVMPVTAVHHFDDNFINTAFLYSCILPIKKCILSKSHLFYNPGYIIKGERNSQSVFHIFFQDGNQNMKITLQQITEGNEEVIIRYRQMTDQIDGIVSYIERQSDKLLGRKEGQQFMIQPQDVIYLESVDGVTYLYTEQEVYKSNLTLMSAETNYADEGYFRCSKSMVINIYRIKKLKSLSGNRIDATMDNDEHVVISRRYAKELRNVLKGEA